MTGSARDIPGGSDTPSSGYLRDARRPLTVLVFLLPAIAFHAVGSLVAIPGVALSAERVIDDIFRVFGVFGRHLPSIALVVFLIVQHLIRRDPWKVRVRTLGGMLVESLVMALPLIVLARAMRFGALADAVDVQNLGLIERATIAVGAGLFEETLYRLVLITLLHAIVVDGLGVRARAGWAIAILGSAVVFALAHHVPTDLASEALTVRAFYFLAATWFGVLFALRGLGICVGAHIVYDLAALL